MAVSYEYQQHVGVHFILPLSECSSVLSERLQCCCGEWGNSSLCRFLYGWTMLCVDYDRMGDIVEHEASFYSNAEHYWKDVPPTVDGMLGGYGSISNIDINGSKAFLCKFLGVRHSFNMSSSTFVKPHGKITHVCSSDCALTYFIWNEVRS